MMFHNKKRRIHKITITENQYISYITFRNYPQTYFLRFKSYNEGKTRETDTANCRNNR